MLLKVLAVTVRLQLDMHAYIWALSTKIATQAIKIQHVLYLVVHGPY